MDKVTEVLLAALKTALARPGEFRLYRSGKLGGLFPSRSGPNGEAAARALREGLLEVVRSELKTKTTVDWVKLTPRGVNFVHENESPVELLRELRTLLEMNREGIPVWLAKLQEELHAQGERLAQQLQEYIQRFDSLTQRAEEALRRAEVLGPAIPDSLSSAVPWAADALTYLEKREVNGAGGCPLPELFSALHDQHVDLSLSTFHDGLRRLHDRRLLQLLPAPDGSQPLPEPEFALVNDDAVLYFAAR